MILLNYFEQNLLILGISIVHSFWLLSPLCGYSSSCLSVHPLMGIGIVYGLGLL